MGDKDADLKSSTQMKTYEIIDKLEILGAKSGVVVNRKLTLLGSFLTAVVTVIVFGGAVLVRSFWKHVKKAH